MPAKDSVVSDPSDDTAHSQPLLAALVSHYDELVDHLCRRFGREFMAHEIVHDAWLQIHALQRIRPVHSPLGLLRKILHNLAVDHCRRSDTRQALMCHLDEPPEAPCERPSVERIVAAKREMALLVSAIQNLPPRCKQIFILHKIHGLSQSDVARILQISVKTVEKHLRLGIRACRARLADNQARRA